MGLTSLFLFTLLGGLAAGAYVFDTCFNRKREGDRPWLMPVVVVVLFAVGLIAAATHVHSIPRAFEALFGGTVNFGSGMIWEVAIAGVFLILALVDMILVLAKKSSPFALRVAAAVFAAFCMISMATAYINVYGNVIWANAPATIVSFVAGDLAAGLGLYAVVARASYGEKTLRNVAIAAAALFAVGAALEIAAFAGAGENVVMQAIALVCAVAAAVFAALSSKFKNGNVVAIVVCVLLIVGVAVSRYAFYAAGAVM